MRLLLTWIRSIWPVRGFLNSDSVRYTGTSTAIVAESFVRKNSSIFWCLSDLVLASSNARSVILDAGLSFIFLIVGLGMLIDFASSDTLRIFFDWKMWSIGLLSMLLMYRLSCGNCLPLMFSFRVCTRKR